MTAIAIAALAASSAQAQTSVTLYGVADVFVEYSKAGTVTAPTTGARLQSGGANGSRVGIKASQELMAGLKANVVIEHGLLFDTGSQVSTSSFWNRQAFVGLSGDWGSLTGGRHYSPLLTLQDTFDPALSTTGYGSAYNSGVMRTFSRVDNSLLYTSPTTSGMTAALMLGFGEKNIGSGALPNSGASYGTFTSGSIKYQVAPFGLGFAVANAKKVDTTHSDKTIWNLSGSYQLGDAQVFAAVQRTRNDSQLLAVTNDDRREYLLGGTYTIGAGQIRTSYGQATLKDVDASTVRHISLAYVHNLTKQAALYAIVQQVRNPANLGYRSTGYTFDAIADGVPAGAGVNANAGAVGFRYRF